MAQAVGRRSILPGLLVAFAAIATRVAAADLPRLHVSLQSEVFGYPDADSSDEDLESFFEARLRGAGRIGPPITWRFEGRAVADDAGNTAGGFSVREDSRRRPVLSLLSAVVDFRPGAGWRLSAGKLLVAWSIIDELEPASLVMPRDGSDPFRRVDLGVYGASAHYGGERASLELIVVPLAFSPSRLPQGRWSIVPEGTPGRAEIPPVRLDETQAGLRIAARFGQLDGALLGYVGRDVQPLFVAEPRVFPPLAPTDFRVVSRTPRIRAGGFHASHPVGERLLARTEVVFLSSPDRSYEDFLQAAGGFEYALGNWRAVLNYLRDERIRRAPEPALGLGERRFLRSTVFGELRYDDGARVRAQLRGGFDTRDEILLGEIDLSTPIGYGLRFAVTGLSIQSGSSPYFDRIRHEDRVGARLEYVFQVPVGFP